MASRSCARASVQIFWIIVAHSLLLTEVVGQTAVTSAAISTSKTAASSDTSNAVPSTVTSALATTRAATTSTTVAPCLPNLTSVLYGTDNMTELIVTWECSDPSEVHINVTDITHLPSSSRDQVEEVSTSSTSYLFQNLSSGHTYDIYVRAGGGQSNVNQITLVPASVIDVQYDVISTTSVNVTWSKQGFASRYRVSWENNTDYKSCCMFEVFALTPGKKTTISVTSIANNVTGNSEFFTVASCPETAENFEAATINSTSVNISWTVGKGHVSTFVILADGQQLSNLTADGSTQYNVIETFSAGKRTLLLLRSLNFKQEFCTPNNVTAYTDPETPTLTVVEIKNFEAVLLQTFSNGTQQDLSIIRYCRVEPLPLNCSSDKSSVNEASSVTHTVGKLLPGAVYEANGTVRSHNRYSLSTNSTVFITVPLAPTGLTMKSRTSASIELQWNVHSTGYQTGFILMGSHLENYTAPGRNAKMYNVTSGLLSGYSYNFTAFATTEFKDMNQTSIASNRLCATVEPQLNESCQVLENAASDQSQLVLNIVACGTASGKIDHWILNLSHPIASLNSTIVPYTDLKVSLREGVVPGRKHQLIFYARVDGCPLESPIDSRPLSLNFTAPPVEPTVSAIANSSNVMLNLSVSEGFVSFYLITCNSSSCPKNGSIVQNTTVLVDDLEAYRLYTFNVTYFSEDGVKSTGKIISVNTTAAVPSKIGSLTVFQPDLSTRPRTVNVTWTAPGKVYDERLGNYSIEFGRKGSSLLQTSVLPTSTSTELHDLDPGREYVFQISATNSAGTGTPRMDTVLLNVTNPALNEDFDPDFTAVDTSSLKVKLNSTTFSDRHGPVKDYQIVVLPHGLNSSSVYNESWHDAERASFKIGYLANNRCNLFDQSASCEGVDTPARRAAASSVLYTVGGSMCSQRGSYCNGPLPAGTSLRLALRAYTSPSLHSDSAHSRTVATKPLEPNNDKNKVTEIVVPVVLVVVLGGLGAGIFLWYRRRKATPQKARHIERIEIPELKRSNPVPTAYFEDHYISMSRDSQLLFTEEYEDLRLVGMNQARNASNLEANRSKNRFVNILPYDHSRVKLASQDDVPGSDYINANYMPGFNSPREFIVTQGPLPSTRDDFWRMVWEQECRAIVMLTKCVEKGREKCDHYWPEGTNPVVYGEIEVAINNETRSQDWNISKLRLSKEGEESRSITHFHYTTWPDFGVPENHHSLIRFVRAVRSKLTREGGPVVVHCSAGVGRSGTFIVLDRSLQLIRETDTVDLFGIVYEMRGYRSFMVQTELQYVFIHKCLLCVLRGDEDEDLNRHGTANQAFEDDEGVSVEIENGNTSHSEKKLVGF